MAQGYLNRWRVLLTRGGLEWPVSEIINVLQQVNCLLESPLVLCIIRDTTNPQWNRCKITINLQSRMTVRELCEEIARQANYEVDTFNLMWLRSGQDGDDNVLMNELGSQTLGEAGLLPDNRKNYFEIQDKDGIQPVPINAGATGITVTNGDDNIAAMAAAASARNDSDDTQPLVTAPTVDTCATFTDYTYGSYASALTGKSESGYVGLINQAMTCYLNSLLQTLYMTPEFRNALYRWCFDESVEDPTKSIPYQLQRLFVQLQTSTKRSIETYDVTRSFGWDSNEAWHQHDVQELCRVMFDALEMKFKNTENEDLINRLYQGQMKDYVKCLECSHESARKDSFLDIPLVIRPFGSTRTYGSVQEALQAFIMPETLNESNQYFCEHCNKKCDAHKGLKFLSFPYILTLQLKRFDFDYTTYARLKLNDKVTFPEVLDMNAFLDDEKEQKEEEEEEITTQSDKQNDEFNPEAANVLGNAGRSDSSDDTIDEGIDVEQAASATSTNKSQTAGPYLYELFSIMVHSGTANGGHYYAYIKSFSDGRWYCFNDTSVTHASKEDIRRTYGIEALPGRSAPNSTLPNAYMLMYRKVEPQKNAGFTTVEQFPSHIKELMVRLQTEEEEERRQREIERNTCKIKLFGVHPMTGKPVEARLEVHKDKTLREATEIAYKLLGFDKHIPLDRCRLVKYDEFHESLERSYEGEEDTPMGTVLCGVKTAYMFDLLLETRKEDQEFAVYRPGGVTNKLFVVDLEAETIANPISMRSPVSTTVQDFKAQIAKTTGLDVETMRVVLEKYYNDLKPLVNGHKTLKNEGLLKSNKVFVESSNIEDRRVPFLESKLFQLLDRYANTIRLQVTLPLSYQDDFKPPKSSSVSPSPSSTSSTDDKYTDLQLETDLALNKAPTPSPTGSSSTLSDDHPLDKNSANLLGSETDSGVVSLNDARINDDLSGDNDGNISELRGSPDGAVDNDGSSNVLMRSEAREGLEIPEEVVQSGDAVSATTAEECWCDGKGCGDCSKLQELNSEHSSGAVPSSLSPLSSLSSPMTGTSDNKSGSTPSDTDPGAAGETGRTEVTYNDPNEDSEDEIYENTRHTKLVNWYFKADPVQIADDSRLLPVYVDKRMSLAVFKKALEPYVGTESQNFKVYRVYANNQEFESIRLTETLQSYSEDSRVVIKLGRALKKGEYRVKIYQLKPNSPEPCKYLFDWVFAKGMTVLQSKTELIPELKAKCLIDVPLNRLRLRKKAWKNPGAIYTDSQVYEDDIPIFTNWEVFIEVLDWPDPLLDSSHLVLFVRRWRPSEFKLDPFEELILSDVTVDELKKELSRLSSISPENVDFAKGKGTFPCEVSLLEMQTDLEWNPHVTSLNSWPLYISDDGAVIYYCDRSEDVKELTEEEKQEIQKKENSRLDRTSQRPNYPSPRKERALKIYTDNTSST